MPIAGVTQQPQEYSTKMAELRFASDYDSPFNFVTGAYYQKDDNEFNVHVVTTDGSGGPQPFDPLNSDDALLNGGNTFFGRTRADEVEQKAVFGEVSYDFGQFKLTAGGRYYDFDESRDFISGGLFANGDRFIDDKTSSNGFIVRVRNASAGP